MRGCAWLTGIDRHALNASVCEQAGVACEAFFKVEPSLQERGTLRGAAKPSVWGSVGSHGGFAGIRGLHGGLSMSGTEGLTIYTRGYTRSFKVPAPLPFFLSQVL
jgi:hypothetical protein